MVRLISNAEKLILKRGVVYRSLRNRVGAVHEISQKLENCLHLLTFAHTAETNGFYTVQISLHLQQWQTLMT